MLDEAFCSQIRRTDIVVRQANTAYIEFPDHADRDRLKLLVKDIRLYIS